MKKTLFFLILFVTTTISWSQGLKADGKKIVNSSGEEVILKGIGPGGWQIMEGYMMQTSGVAGSQHEIKEKLIDLMGESNTEIFFTKWRENHFTKRDVDSLAAWGFNSIRIPMHYNLFTLPIEEEPVAGENTWIETGFELIDNVLEWSEPYGIYVILDLHAAPGGQGTGSEINDYDPSKPSLWESQANKDKTVALWTRIADRYKDNEWIGGYDILNEPHWDLPGGTDLRQLYVDITNGIRSVDTEHILYIEGNWYANDHTGLTPPWDDNLVYSFHKYWSYNSENDLDWILPLREEHNVPLWMGESGENSNTWFTDAVKLFEDNGIGWAWWTMRKIGDIDSPYAVDINPGYQKIIDYWKGEGVRPTEQEAFNGMMQLAENLLVENSNFRKDVPDALIRQPHTDETNPYNGAPTAIPGIVHMSDFDLGKNNFAYYDVDAADYSLSTGEWTAWNSGWSYRNDGVDIEKNEDNINSNGFHVGFINKGEWLKYTVDVDETANYKASVRLATQDSGGEFFLLLDSQEITTTQVVNSTGGWTKFITYEISDIIIEEGEHALKIYFSSEKAFNISSIEFEKIGTVDAVPLNALNGKTGENEMSVEIAISEAVLPTSLDGSLNSFTITVNGEEKNITSVTADASKDRTIILTIEDFIMLNDEVKVSYSGTTIKSQSNKTLNTFTNLKINNQAKERAVIPGKIEVEDYEFMIGMALEDTEDEGGGQNFGYTDAGDYADYSILVPKSGTYGINFRVSGYDQGSIGVYSVDENNIEHELLVVTTPITNGWQSWETFSDNVYIEKGIHKLRLKILIGGFNFNWIEFGYPDSDLDGVLDDEDKCSDTPEGDIVDVNGCSIFSLLPSNYSITIASETCRESNNGSLSIAVNESHNYKVTLTSESGVVSNTFTSQTEFNNLTAGTYNVCFTIEEQLDYEQCFTIVVAEPKAFIVTASKDSKSSKIAVKLSGSSIYYVTLNDETFITEESNIELNLKDGINSLSVKTNLDCQGVFNQVFNVNNKPVVYPNPVQNNKLFVNLGNLNLSKTPIEIYSATGQLLFSKVYQIKKNILQLDVSNIPSGVFIVKIVTEEDTFNYKILK